MHKSSLSYIKYVFLHSVVLTYIKIKIIDTNLKSLPYFRQRNCRKTQHVANEL